MPFAALLHRDEQFTAASFGPHAYLCNPAFRFIVVCLCRVNLQRSRFIADVLRLVYLSRFRDGEAHVVVLRKAQSPVRN